MNQLNLQSNEADHHQQPPPIEVILSISLGLTDRIRHAVHKSRLYKLECAQVGKQVDNLSHMIHRFAHTNYPSYERPVRGILYNVIGNLKRALSLIRKCHHRGIILRFFSIVGDSDFKKLFNLLNESIDNMKWLISVFDDRNEGIVLNLPPIASNVPSLAWIWSCIALLHARSLDLKTEAAQILSILARDIDRNKKIIVEEGGVMPLLKLLNYELAPETQIAGAVALLNLANNRNRVRCIFNEHGVPVLAQALRNSNMSVQIEVVKLIARMAEHDSVCQDGFARKNVIETLVILLSRNVFDDGHAKRGTPGLLLELNAQCSGALWMLVRGNVGNCRRITETRGLLCLAKLIEKETGELQINCLRTVTEITSVVESNPDIRRKAFKTSSSAAKAVADELLRLISESDNKPEIMIPTIRAIGQLARTFHARQTRVIISALAQRLGHKSPDVATESVIALAKFICPENYLRAEHSKTMLEFEVIQPLMAMLKGDERTTRYHALVLLCYLAETTRNLNQQKF